MRVVAALGGNALLRRGEPMTVAVQRQNARRAAAALAPLARTHDLVVTHGNGPQVGLLALQAELDPGHGPVPFDLLGAETEGAIGYVLEQELGNALPGRELATILTRTVVDAADPALQAPTKFVGQGYEDEEAQRLADERGWQMRRDGDRMRRVVGSPEPREIVELPAIRLLVDAGMLVICAGGGGVPVTRSPDGLAGIEAVVDKDLTAALLAEELEADLLLLLTDVEGVLVDGRPVELAGPEALRAFGLPAGSMGPKAEAAARFVERTGGHAAIGSLEAASELALGLAGTQVATGAPLPAGA